MKSCLKALNSLPVALIFAAAVVSGCSSVPVNVNEGAVPAKTFSFLDIRVKANPGFAESRAEMHKAVQDAVTRNLAEKGVTRVESGGDITVGYLVVVASNITTKSISDYFGYGPDNDALLAKAHEGVRELRDKDPATRIRDPKTYRVGALVIDVLDSKTSILQYRNVGYSELLNEASDELRAKRLQTAVNHILSDLKIVKGP